MTLDRNRPVTTLRDRTQPEVVLLAHKMPGERYSADVDGLMMYDPEGGVLYSHGGVWHKITGTPLP